MQIEPCFIEGVFLVSSPGLNDERGSFSRVYCRAEFEAAGIEFGPIVQSSLSFNKSAYTLRGMHWQSAPYAESKFVRICSGRIFDVVVDLRSQSPTFRKWFGVELDSAKGQGLFIPKDCAHGFITLTPDCLISYFMDSEYESSASLGFRYNDPLINIAWPHSPSVISARDLSYPDLTR